MDPEGSLSHSQNPATSPLGCTEGSVRLQRFCDFSVTWLSFHGEELLAPCPTSKLEDRPLSAVRDCLFNIFAATLHIWRRSSIRNLRTRHAVVTGTHLPRNK
jgi:hypothetical protein